MVAGLPFLDEVSFCLFEVNAKQQINFKRWEEQRRDLLDENYNQLSV